MSLPETSGPDNQDFMESFRRGDRAAFRWVFDHVCGDLFVFVEGVVKDQAAADRIVSECFYRLFYQREGMASYEGIRSWLFIVAKGQCLAYLNG